MANPLSLDFSPDDDGIKTRFAANGRLINQIVGTIYGLTAEEIAIVEGKP